MIRTFWDCKPPRNKNTEPQWFLIKKAYRHWTNFKIKKSKQIGKNVNNLM